MNLYSTPNDGGYQRALYSALASDYMSFGSDFAGDLRERGDTSEYAYSYLGGLLRMPEKRNFANIASTTGVAG